MKKIILLLAINLWASGVWADSQVLRPDANGYYIAEMTKNGCASEWQCVDDVTPDRDTTYLSTKVVGERSTSYLTDCTLSSVDSIIITVNAAKSAGLGVANGIAIGYHIGGEVPAFYSAATFTLTTTWTNFTIKLTTDNESNPWTASSINAHSFGCKLNGAVTPAYLWYTQVFVTAYGTITAPSITGRRTKIIQLLGEE